jgi:hypothetical protein
MRKTPHKKRVARGHRPRTTVDPLRMALVALERIRTVLVRSGHEERLGEGVSAAELEARAAVLGTVLPPSYVAVLEITGSFGEPEMLLRATGMAAEGERLARFGGEAAKRYIPFCRSGERIYCFDRGTPYEGVELPVVAWHEGMASPAAAHFGEWLDGVADAREEALEAAAEIPLRLKQLLYDLGFRFEHAVVGRLETGDVEAIEALIGAELASTVRGTVDRLFDSSGKASLSLNVDEFTVAVSLRTGIYLFQAEDVFRWLRTFRDENFFSGVVAASAQAAVVRDLRRAPREPPLVQRGVTLVSVTPAKELSFCGVAGDNANDFYLLARTANVREGAPSVILHIEGGSVEASHRVEAPLHDLHVDRQGTLWGLTTTHAVRIADGRAQSFPLRRPTPGRAWWYGIGSFGRRVVVWGASALLMFDGEGFVPFEPDALLDEMESALALHAAGERIWMLVGGDQIGAVGRFDSVSWLPIEEHQLIAGKLADLDVWRGAVHVLDRDGGLWKLQGGDPKPVALRTYHHAFRVDSATPRVIHGVRATSSGLLLASDGGVIAVGDDEPLFHALPNDQDPVRLFRLGERSGAEPDEDDPEPPIVAVCGPHALVWRNGLFSALDLHRW